jgi:hypothetical protein
VHGVPAGDAPLRRGPLQVGDAAGGVAGEVHRGAPDPQGLGIVDGHAVIAHGHAEPVQPQPLQVGPPAEGQEQLLHHDVALAGAHPKAAVAALHLRLVPQPERKLALEDVHRGAVHGRVLDAREALAVVDAGDGDTEAMQRLADLQADGAEADDGHRRRQLFLLEDLVHGEDAVGELGAPGRSGTTERAPVATTMASAVISRSPTRSRWASSSSA